MLAIQGSRLRANAKQSGGSVNVEAQEEGGGDFTISDSVADGGFTTPGIISKGFEPWGGTGATSSSNFYLGTYDGAQQSTDDYILGMFFHTESLSEEEMWLLRQEIEIARDIPVVPKLAGSPVLDHIWSAKKRFSVGSLTGQTSGDWVSTGAVGGKSLAIGGSGSDADLEIIEALPTFGAR
jgi:hypothetical protein